MTTAPALARPGSGSFAPTRELPAWPVLALIWGAPVWWATGLLAFISIILALPMLALLIRRGRIGLVPGVLPLLVFTAWTIPCAVMLDSGSRFLAFTLSFGQLLSVAILLLYVVNARTSLTAGRLMAALTSTWIFIIIGGYLGILWPDGSVTYTIGRLLPASISGNDYLASLLYPPFAEVQLPYGASEPFLRPSAPFTYTNGWGAGFAILTPIAIATAVNHGTKRAFFFVGLALVAAVPPAIATSNRGLFLGLIAATAYVIFRLALRGQWKPVIAVGLAGIAAFSALAATGLIGAIAARQEAGDTTQGRSELYVETFERTLLSPILGYGSSRPSFTSEINVGTQGMIWEVMFSFGLVGLALFAVFMVGAVLRTWRAPSIPILWLHASLVTATMLALFYGLDRHLGTIAIVAGLLLRERYADRSEFWEHALPSTVINTTATNTTVTNTTETSSRALTRAP